jgi:squalene synthase HpnC
VSVQHYENFPVASVLCPPALRPAVQAIYHFARTADDIADEGQATDAQRLADLAAFRAELRSLIAGRATTARWSRIFEPLDRAVTQHALPTQFLHDLLDAFEQDVRRPAYPDRGSLLDYCRRSANPIGRLLLHLYGVSDAQSIQRADAICTALQLTNFWQDLSVDLPRGRCYVPAEDLQRHGLEPAQLRAGADTVPTRALVRDLVEWTREQMRRGAPLAHRLPGRAGWEMRLVVQGGLRILEKIEQKEHAALSHRPRIVPLDVPVLLWRAAVMRR